MRYISIEEFSARTSKLPSNGRSKIDSLDDDLVVYHRIPIECYEKEDRFFESKLQDWLFSIPDQSITIKLDHIDEIDALIEFNDATDTYNPKLDHGVVWWSKSQLTSIVLLREDTKRNEVSCLTTCCLDVVHTPYRLNYYHGDISTVVDYRASTKPSKTVRKLIRNTVIDQIYANSQFCISPNEVEFEVSTD
jgi:hypothetical protein